LLIAGVAVGEVFGEGEEDFLPWDFF